ncbi:flagellar hook protein FlgE [Paraburkholderia pallida]|uniref:Flagellar hook protein FlgE n=1 Tax=Paraburkholderia pallida TaxID=2547399 RepID=A0A4P7CQ25_9BURK|nr:flagellar hook protein FlgE [Paraburkholderia pallida]QBQ96344.1 flagellar hook protein FlgE [Paraburkholderia pallida]
MGYQQGLSGLAAASNDLDVIGNNIANANTVGFKQSTAQFADVYANSVATAVNTQIGLGAALSQVQQNFSQGTITTTGQALDVAINGNGFFQMSNNGTVTYSRNGVFQLDKNGYITDASGNDLMGYAAGTNGVVNSAQTVPLQVPTTNIAPVTTANITAQLNLNAQSTAPTGTSATFDPTNSNTYNYSTSITAYDSLGGAQQINMYFVKGGTDAAGNQEWNVYAGTPGNVSTSPVGTMSFNSSGNLVATADSTGAATSIGQIPIAINPTDGSTQNQKITLNFTGTTQFGSTNGVNNLTQDGYASGTLSNFSIGSDGSITGNYSNGQTKTLGQVVLANFNNPNGLENLGGNQFQETAASGVPQVSTPGSTNHGSLTGGAVESSNVDLTNQLVDLITAQRNYQANAQTIKTQQTVDQTLLQM